MIEGTGREVKSKDLITLSSGGVFGTSPESAVDDHQFFRFDSYSSFRKDVTRMPYLLACCMTHHASGEEGSV